MPTIDEDRVVDAVEEYLAHQPGTVAREVHVAGDRVADLVVADRPAGRRPLAIEVESTTDEYRNGLGQCAHYRRVGYVPMLALPIAPSTLVLPGSDTGEALNAAAGHRVGLLGVTLEDDAVAGVYEVLRPFE